MVGYWYYWVYHMNPLGWAPGVESVEVPLLQKLQKPGLPTRTLCPRSSHTSVPGRHTRGCVYIYTHNIYIYIFNTHIIMIYIMMYIASHWLFNLWYPLVISLWSMLVSQPARLPVGSHWGRSRHDDALSFSDAQACPQGEYNPLRNQSRCAVCPFGAQWLGKHRRRQHGYCIIQITQAHVGGWSGLCTLRFIWCKSQVESILPIRPHFPNTMFLPRTGHYCTVRSIGPYRVLLMQSTARFCPSCYGGFNGTGATSFYADEGFYLLGSDEDVTHLMLWIGWDKSDLFGWALAVRP
jgi:hypothetical protein